MTTLVANTLANKASGKYLPLRYHTEGGVKSFAGGNGLISPFSIATSFNISSVTDATVGNFIFIHAIPFVIQSAPSGACHHTSNHWMLMSPAPSAPSQVNTITNRLSTLSLYHDCDKVSFSACGRLP